MEVQTKEKKKSNRLFKHKACINVHGSKKEYDKNLFETFSPVVTWFTITILLVLYIINGWITRQVDFIPVFLQDDI